MCSLKGANALTNGNPLDKNNCSDCEKHHVFPKSKIVDSNGKEYGNLAVNCILIPGPDNREFSNLLPGDYIAAIYKKKNINLVELDVVNYLETHLIAKESARSLIKTKQKRIEDSSIKLEDQFEDFIKKRSEDIEIEIKRLAR